MMDTAQRKLLIIGNGMAATRLLDELVALNAPQSITVVGEEDAPGYNRILLSSWLADGGNSTPLVTHDHDWYQRQGIELISGDPVVAVDTLNRRARTCQGRTLSFDQLVLATGSRAARLAIAGADLDNVMTFRTLADCHQMRQLSTRMQRAVVIGGGLLGLEAAHGLNQLGMRVSVVHNAPWLMNRQLDAEAGAWLADRLRQRGIEVITDASTRAFVGSERVTGVQLDDRLLPCDLAVMAIGITPEISLAQDAGLECQRAIRVDRGMQTSEQAIFALGECCQIDGECFGLVEPIHQQASILARRLCNRPTRGYQHQPLPTRLKVSGVDVFSAGDLTQLDDCRSLVWRDPVGGRYRRLWFRNDRLVAVVMFGDVTEGNRYFERIQQDQPVARPDALILDAEAA